MSTPNFNKKRPDLHDLAVSPYKIIQLCNRCRCPKAKEPDPYGSGSFAATSVDYYRRLKNLVWCAAIFARLPKRFLAFRGRPIVAKELATDYMFPIRNSFHVISYLGGIACPFAVLYFYPVRVYVRANKWFVMDIDFNHNSHLLFLPLGG